MAVARPLLEHGADVNAKEKLGKTPLDWAVQIGKAEVVELLHKHGAKK